MSSWVSNVTLSLHELFPSLPFLLSLFFPPFPSLPFLPSLSFPPFPSLPFLPSLFFPPFPSLPFLPSLFFPPFSSLPFLPSLFFPPFPSLPWVELAEVFGWKFLIRLDALPSHSIATGSSLGLNVIRMGCICSLIVFCAIGRPIFLLDSFIFSSSNCLLFFPKESND